jgi:lipoyl-dependent peroxiredoxin
MSLGSGAFEGAYTFESRFKGDDGTNPEELIAAALAGCFTMQLSYVLGESGHVPEALQSQAKVSLRQTDAGPAITKIALTTQGKVAGVDEAVFKEAAGKAKESCLISRALAGVPEITVEPTLES